MEHIAIDLGSRKSQICIRSAGGEIVEERRVDTKALCGVLRGRGPGRVIVEACAEAFFVADIARGCGHEVRVVPSTLAPALGIGERKTKTDRRDAQKLSEVSTRVELTSVHVPSQQARDIKSECATREALVSARTQLVNMVRGWARQSCVTIGSGTTTTFVRRFLDAVKEPPEHLVFALESIDELTKRIVLIEKSLEERAKKNDVCRRLMTVPGVGPIIALRFLAAVDDIGRFANAHDLEAYLGLTPGEHSSGSRTRRVGITKAGSTKLRWALVQGAWAARRKLGHHPMLTWATEVEKRRGKRVAAVALARKIAGILFAIWRSGTTYDPRKAAASFPELPTPALFPAVLSSTPAAPVTPMLRGSTSFRASLPREGDRAELREEVDFVESIAAPRRTLAYAALTANIRLRQLEAPPGRKRSTRKKRSGP